MQNLQDVFNRVRGTKNERKNIQALYKDALTASQNYKEITEKISGYKLQKKKIEEDVKTELGSQYEKLIALKKDMDLDKELLTDIAISQLMKGETVAIEDEDKNVYEPIFSVKFKKTNVISQKS